MKRYMWHCYFRKANGQTGGMSSGGINGLVDQALRLNACTITLYREKEIKGKLPILAEMRAGFTPKRKLRKPRTKPLTPAAKGA